MTSVNARIQEVQHPRMPPEATARTTESAFANQQKRLYPCAATSRDLRLPLLRGRRLRSQGNIELQLDQPKKPVAKAATQLVQPEGVSIPLFFVISGDADDISNHEDSVLSFASKFWARPNTPAVRRFDSSNLAECSGSIASLIYTLQ